MTDREPIPHVALISLEPWDDVWRRNQHLSAELVRSGTVGRLTFVTPPTGGLALRAGAFSPQPGIEVVTPPLVVPRTYGGQPIVNAWVRRRLREVDLLWINDPVTGAAVRRDLPAVYDVTDDWRSMPQSAQTRDAIIAAENNLAKSVPTIVCSEVLATRWNERYGVEASVVPNGIDLHAFTAATARKLVGRGPHAVYVGTLHDNRVDLELLAHVCREWPGTVHLVGPNHLTPTETEALSAVGAAFEGLVPARDVPSWMKAADALICPHLVDEFTLSLDAIKAHEYLATDRPVVATPSSGFQSLRAPGLSVASGAEFVASVLAAPMTGPTDREPAASWSDRAGAFGEELRQAWARPRLR